MLIWIMRPVFIHMKPSSLIILKIVLDQGVENTTVVGRKERGEVVIGARVIQMSRGVARTGPKGVSNLTISRDHSQSHGKNLLLEHFTRTTADPNGVLEPP